jgi:hypothetical protein
MSRVYIISSEEAWSFFNTDHYWQENRVDGRTIEDLEFIMKDGYHIGYYHNGTLVCVTKVDMINNMDAEVHTYVNPSYIRLSEVALRAHIQFLSNDQGYTRLYTTSSNVNKSCYNFLTKRLGFETYNIDTECNVTRDGQQLIIYRMMKTL